MQHINQTNRAIGQLGEFNKTNSPIGDSKNYKVDRLLESCSDIIHNDYKKWFAKHFFSMEEDTVIRLAHEARADGKDPSRLFSYLIKRNS